MKSIIRFLFLTISIFIIDNIISNSNGPGGGYSGAPSENNCTNCHGSFSLQTSGVNFNKIKLDIPFTGNGYIPDSTYLLKISYKETGKTVFGFQITALDAKNNEAAGTFTANDSRTQTGNYTIAGKTRYYAEHTSSGKSSVATDSVAWFVKWKAPNKNVGTIRFHLNLNVTNDNGGTSGDYIYKKSFDIQPSTLLPKATASIKDSIICSGKAIQFSGSGTQSTSSYQWSFPGASTTTSTSQNPLITYSTTGNFIAILTVKNNKGSSLPDTIRFRVLQGATKPTINLTGSVNICSGDSIRLSANNITGHTLSWMPVNNKKSSLFVKDTGTFFAMSTNSVGCTRNSDNVTIKVLTKPSGLISTSDGQNEYCLNSTIRLKMAYSNTDVDSFSITGPTSGFGVDSIFDKNATLIGNLTFTGWVKAKNGCVSSPSKTTVLVKDSVSSPIVTVEDTGLTQLKFRWLSNLGTAYLYSIDKGKSWQYPSLADTATSQIIKTPTANYEVDFWLKSLSNHVCKESKTSFTKTKTLACTPINYSISAKPLSKSCVDSTLVLSLNTQLSQYRWAVNQDTLNNGTYYNYKLNKGNNSVIVSLMNLNESICGYTVKQFSWNADTMPNIQWKNELLTGKYCRKLADDTVQIPMVVSTTGNWKNIEIFNNLFNNTTTYPSTFLAGIVNKKSPVINVKTTTDSGCIYLTEIDSVNIVDLPSADFSINNSADYIYLFQAADNNLKSYSWQIGDSLSTLPSFSKDLFGYRSKKISVKLSVSNDGQGCINQKEDSLFIALSSLIQWKLQSTNIFPNPINIGESIFIRMGANHPKVPVFCEIIDSRGTVVDKPVVQWFDNNLHLIPRLTTPGIYFIKIQLLNDTTKTETIINQPIIVEGSK